MQDRAVKTGYGGLDEQAHQQQVLGRLDQTVVDYKSSTQMLDGPLNKDEFFLLAVLKDVSGIRKLERHIEWEKSRREAKDFVHPYPGVKRMVDGMRFEGACGIVMWMNGVLIGLQSMKGVLSDEFYKVSEHIFFS